METKNASSANIFASLMGEQLSSVCFVQDYLQIEFDGYKITAYTMPIIIVPDKDIIDYKHISYKNELCDFIAKRVINIIYEEDQYVEVYFNGCESIIKIILRNNVDNIYYTDHNEKWFVI